jgi:cell division protein FtsA
MKRTRIAGIDVGTTKICTIMADTDGNSAPRILGVGIVPSRGLQKGMVVNVNEAKASIRESIKKAEQSAGYKLESAYVGVTGRHITAVNNRGAIAITRNDRLVRGDDLKRVLDVARSVKVVPTDQQILHMIPRTWVVDGQDGVKNPVGMHGFRLDVETHIITAAATSIQNLTKCIRGCGIEVEDLVMEPLASAEAVLTDEEKMDGTILADIGGGTTDIAVFKDNSIYHTAVIPVAGYQITRDISVGLDLSFELAEEMKKKYGNVLPGEADDRADDQTLTEDGHSVSYRDLSEIVRVRVEELLRLIVLELPRSDYSKLVPSGLVLTGGSSNLPGIAELAAAVTHLPVRIGVPMNLYGVADSLYDPAYATAVGLTLWKSRKSEVGTKTWQNNKGMRNWVSRLFSIFK